MSDANDATCDECLLLMMAAVVLLTETRMRLGLDPDGSHTLNRMEGVLGEWDEVAECVSAPGTPYDPAAKAARAKVRSLLRRSRPLLTRMARPN